MKILIVDDERSIRKSLHRVFSLRGHTVFLAENGIEGLSLCKEKQPDVILADVVMPGMTGLQMIEEVQKTGRIKVALMSAYSGRSHEELIQNGHVDLFISKPFANVFDVADQCESLLETSKS